MKNKSFLIILIFALLLAGVGVFVVPNNASAVESTSTGIRKVEQIKEKIEDQKEKIVNRVENKKGEKAQNAIGIRIEVFKRSIRLTEQLLDKIQIRIDKAKAAGKDVSQMMAFMTDARAKLADAKSKLTIIETNKPNVTTQATFKTTRDEFKAVMQDLQAARKDVANIIKILKGFNSATSEGKNPQATGSSPASSSSSRK